MSFSSISRLPLLSILVALGFLLLDEIWVRLLSPLGVSYGSVRPPIAAFVFIRLVIFIFWLIVLAGFAIVRHGVVPRSTIWILVCLNTLVLACGLYGFYIEPMRLTTSRIELRVPGLAHPVRIVQLSDIHVERTTARERALPGLVASLNPDMIVLTGDHWNESYTNDPITVRDLRTLVSQLHAPLGIYAVNGNVETHFQMHDEFDGTDVRLLEDQVVRLPELGDHFVIIGLNYVLPQLDEMTLANLMKQVKPGDYTLLLYHKPDVAYAARDLGIDLYLCGHTHGGQVRLPFYGALYANSRYGRAFQMGLYQLDKTTLYVSRGLGMVGGVGPRMRFLAPPEVVIVDLVPAD